MEARGTWRVVAAALTRPYRLTVPMVLLMLLVPVYLILPDFNRSNPFHRPELPLDRALPVAPVWALIYGALYFFLIVLPILVVRDDDHIRRTFHAYLFVWLTAYVCFVVYPTAAPRPAQVPGNGFAAWGLRFLYGADPPYNCFPSLHVAHSFVSALTCLRLHRRLGIAAILCALLVGLSTLCTKQHYILDVLAGMLLACIAYVVFLRRAVAPELDRRVAPVVATALFTMIAIVLAGCWIAFALSA